MSEPEQPTVLPASAPARDAPRPAPPESVHAYCANCGTPLYGEYCYACGQPVKGLVRHFSSVMSDVVDSVFNIDERLFRTILPLYLRPGRLTLEYFAGRRTRYVTPFRLVFFLAIIAFFSIQITLRSSSSHFNLPTSTSVGTQAKPSQPATHKTPDNQVWARHLDKSLRVAWLPDFVNDWTVTSVTHARAHIEALMHGSNAQRKATITVLMIGMFSVAPTVLFVLLPIFALMLKIFYIFKRRLYMEHLIVAMHSHAFLMLSMLALVVLGLVRSMLAPHAAWLYIPLSLLEGATWIWMVVYLLLMQKRVYRQGWPMTCVKFACIGVCYSVLLTFALAIAMLIALSN